MKDQVDEPMDAINKWQEWYRSNRVIAEIDEPGVPKSSRESLHNTSKAMSVMPVWGGVITEPVTHNKPAAESSFISNCKEKATEYFADTIAEFFNELSGAELFECFLTAAHNNAELVKKEYDKAQELVDLLRCKKQ
jgi:hypothetical protein